MANSKLSMKKVFVSLSGLALGALIVATGAVAANPEPVTVEVEFVAPLTITEVNALQYGLLDENLANTETLIIGTDDSVSGTGFPARIAGGAQAAANLTVTADTGKVIEIQVGNVVNGTGYSLAAFMCSYDGGADTVCDTAPLIPGTTAASATLLVGATLTGNGAAVGAGVQNGSFDVTIVYQ